MKVVASNRRARFDYEITDMLEAGMHLNGQEVKSCRDGNVNLAGAYVSLLNGKPILKSMTIAPYKFASRIEGYDPGRDRLLLLKKREIERLQAVLDEKGLTVIPLEVRAGKFIKILLGIGKGRKKIDKRQNIKEKEIKKKLKKGEEY